MKEHRILRRLGAKHNRRRVLFLGPFGPDLRYLPGLEGGQPGEYLTSGVGEKINLAKTSPDKTAALRKTLDDWLQSMNAKLPHRTTGKHGQDRMK